MGQTLSGKKLTPITQTSLGLWLHLEPVTSKDSQKVENHIYSVGSSSMQGWRISKSRTILWLAHAEISFIDI
jgi:hypothetical protein